MAYDSRRYAATKKRSRASQYARRRSTYYRPRRPKAAPRRAASGSFTRSIASSVASAVGNVLGSSLGRGALTYGSKLAGAALAGPYGMAAADVASAAFNKIVGKGAYSVSHNSLMKDDQVPFMHSTKGGGCRIQHREYLQDIVGSTGFSVPVNLPVQPALASSFPWLSSIASNYQNWKPHGIVYEFKSTSADAIVNGTNTQLGVVIGAIQYNSLNGPFTSKQAMENCQYSVSCKPSTSMLIPVECDPDVLPISELYTRLGDVQLGADQRLYDLGELSIGTSGMPASGNTIGELHVCYDIELMNPIQQDNQTALFQSHYKFSGATTSQYFGASQTELFDNVGISFSTNAVTIPAGYSGQWMYIWINRGAGTGTIQPSIALTNATGVNLFDAQTSSVYQSIVTSGTSVNQGLINSFTITDENSPVVITLSGGTLNTSPANGDFILMQLNAFLV